MLHPDSLIHPDMVVGEPDSYPAAVLAYAGEAEAGTHYPFHRHWRAQLFHIVSGSVTVEAASGSFVVPPERALWIPSSVEHGVTYHQRTSMRYLFFRPEAVAHLPERPTVIRMTSAVRELVLLLMAYPRDAADGGPAGRIAAVILDQLTTARSDPLHLPMPASERLRRAVAALAADPTHLQSLGETASLAAMSERTFDRRFRAETGLGFRAWRQQAKLMKAVEMLSLGAAVGDVADRLGYETSSAFIASFRRAFGTTPGRYFSDTG